MNFKLQKGHLQQRRTLLQQLADYSDHMEEAIKKEDFIRIVEQIEFVGKRYK